MLVAMEEAGRFKAGRVNLIWGVLRKITLFRRQIIGAEDLLRCWETVATWTGVAGNKHQLSLAKDKERGKYLEFFCFLVFFFVGKVGRTSWHMDLRGHLKKREESRIVSGCLVGILAGNLIVWGRNQLSSFCHVKHEILVRYSNGDVIIIAIIYQYLLWARCCSKPFEVQWLIYTSQL